MSHSLKVASGRVWALTALLALLPACDSDTGPDADNFTIAPGDVTILVGQSRQLTAQQAPGPVQWSSSNSQIASVVPETGFVTAIARGQATITALSAGVARSVTVTVEIEPAIGLGQPSVVFTRLTSDPHPGPVTVQITNVGDQTLDDLTLGTITYTAQPVVGTAPSSQSWLTATLSSSAAPATLTLTVGDGNEVVGENTATIPILSNQATNSPQSLLVTYQVQRPAVITANPNPAQVTAIPNSVSVDTVQIANGGDAPLTGLSTSVSYSGASGWLTATLSGPDAPANLVLQSNSSGLTTGTYNATVTISSSDPSVAPLALPVEFIVTPGPAINVTTSVTFNATNGTNPARQSYTISNGGGGTLTGLTAAVTSGGSWLTASLGGTTAPASLHLDVASSTLSDGTYNGSVQVSSPVASNSPVTVNVQLVVGPAPDLQLNPGSLTFSSFAGATIQPGPQDVAVTNAGGGTISNLTASVAYSGASGWLLPQFVGGFSAPTTLRISAFTGSLPAGTYTATVTVSAPGVASKSINVTFQVRSFTTSIANQFGSCDSGSCHGGGSAPTLSGSASNIYSALVPTYVPTNGNTNASALLCKITNGSEASSACTITGTNMTLGAAAVASIREWIQRGAPN